MKKFLVFCLTLLFGCSDSYFSSDERSTLSDKSINNPASMGGGTIVVPPKIDITNWLTAHPTVASSIKWQIAVGSDPVFPFYHVQEVDKLSWPYWSIDQKLELKHAVDDAYNWYFFNYAGQDAIPTIPNHDVISPTQTATCYISDTDAHNLFIRWVAHSLFIEVYNIFKWSVTTYDSESLALLFDSSRFMRKGGGFFSLGYDNVFYQPNRRDLIGSTVISAPIYTFKFLFSNGVIYENGAYQNKQSVIENLIKWSKTNMVHYYGDQSAGNVQTFWGYPFVPFDKVAEGTTYNGSFEHWTAGCDGTTSFFAHALRAANIPVQYATNRHTDQYQQFDCGHRLMLFPTEGLFIDHGDNPYNLAYKASGFAPSYLLRKASDFPLVFPNESFNSSANLIDQNACDGFGSTVDLPTY